MHEHELTVGGRVRYAMSGPDGEEYPGWWRITAVEAPTGLSFEDGFGDPDAPADLPVTRTRVAITDLGGGRTRMVLEGSFPSAEAMAELLAMGMQEGLAGAVGQSDALLMDESQHSV